jgi:(p)ppGpp synthase/HD superfamily hydrolase
MSNLDNAIALAVKAHAGQVDKAGQTYILHPLRLMFKFQNESHRIVAVLHDVVEDSDTTLADLTNLGFSAHIVKAIDCLSKKPGEHYDDFILRLSSNELAKAIKIEDLKDNLNLTRMDVINEKDLARAGKYHKALMRLLMFGDHN